MYVRRYIYIYIYIYIYTHTHIYIYIYILFYFIVFVLKAITMQINYSGSNSFQSRKPMV